MLKEIVEKLSEGFGGFEVVKSQSPGKNRGKKILFYQEGGSFVEIAKTSKEDFTIYVNLKTGYDEYFRVSSPEGIDRTLEEDVDKWFKNLPKISYDDLEKLDIIDENKLWGY